MVWLKLKCFSHLTCLLLVFVLSCSSKVDVTCGMFMDICKAVSKNVGFVR
ncbi:hypothetical protein O6H91_03G096900 [Diphasiastrum complanatum]|uniref:Uncharacterized protein n=1 Tax=Diphasiastrum complanatum TaxID=34168 RepID=A0ACC2E9C9_DIPCM|nr:hypothetical protein O6H91_03G096900 [Diphasiastrum complanatum]